MDKAMSSTARPSLNAIAVSATIHCLTGCAIGEILGMALGAAFHWDNVTTIMVSIILAFGFGYSLTLIPLVRSGLAVGTAVGLAFASDTLSIALMEIIDNLIMVAIPGAMDAMPDTFLFWGAMGSSLVLAGTAAFPLNRWLIRRGRGHAVIHAHHGDHASQTSAQPAQAHGAHHTHHPAAGNGGQS